MVDETEILPVAKENENIEPVVSTHASAHKLAIAVLAAMECGKDEIALLKRNPKAWYELINAADEILQKIKPQQRETFKGVLSQAFDRSNADRQRMILALEVLKS